MNTTLSPLETHIFKFNETCCEGKGVPEECMGLCRERMLRSIDVYPVNRCVEHQTHIDSCVYEYGKKYVHMYILKIQ
jgi:hypothetical protein